MSEISSKYTFFSYYLKKSHYLFNCDAILLKIVIKMCDHYNQYGEGFDYQTILIEGEGNPCDIIRQGIPEI